MKEFCREHPIIVLIVILIIYDLLSTLINKL
jgi:hypothetical protein